MQAVERCNKSARCLSGVPWRKSELSVCEHITSIYLFAYYRTWVQWSLLGAIGIHCAYYFTYIPYNYQ